MVISFLECLLNKVLYLLVLVHLLTVIFYEC